MGLDLRNFVQVILSMNSAMIYTCNQRNSEGQLLNVRKEFTVNLDRRANKNPLKAHPVETDNEVSPLH